MASQKQVEYINKLKDQDVAWIRRMIDETMARDGVRWLPSKMRFPYAATDAANETAPGWGKRLNADALKAAMVAYIQDMPIPQDAHAASAMIDILKESRFLDTFWTGRTVLEFLQ